MNKISFSGMTPSVIKDAEELFDVVRNNDDGRYLAISKETFEHNEPEGNLVFKYKYIIDACSYNTDWYYSLQLVVLPEYLCQKTKECVANCCSYIDVEEIKVEDIIDYGATIIMCVDKTEGGNINYNMINCIASVFEDINSMRGFYLDRRKVVNGWDLLNEYINGEGAFKTAMDRIK